MIKSQAILLKQLAKSLKTAKRTKEEALETLQDAGIFNAAGELSNNYPNLKRAINKMVD